MTQGDMIWEGTLAGELVNEQLSGQIMKAVKVQCLEFVNL